MESLITSRLHDLFWGACTRQHAFAGQHFRRYWVMIFFGQRKREGSMYCYERMCAWLPVVACTAAASEGVSVEIYAEGGVAAE